MYVILQYVILVSKLSFDQKMAVSGVFLNILIKNYGTFGIHN